MNIWRSGRSGYLVGFAEVDGKIAISAMNGPGVPLRSDGASLVLDFEDMAAGPIVIDISNVDAESAAPATLRISEAGHVESFDLLPDAQDTASCGGDLLGNYRSDDLGADARIVREDGRLRLDVFGSHGASTMSLEKCSRDCLSWKIEGASLPLTGALTLEREAERIAGFRINTLRTRHLAFRRLA